MGKRLEHRETCYQTYNEATAYLDFFISQLFKNKFKNIIHYEEFNSQISKKTTENSELPIVQASFFNEADVNTSTPVKLGEFLWFYGSVIKSITLSALMESFQINRLDY